MKALKQKTKKTRITFSASIYLGNIWFHLNYWRKNGRALASRKAGLTFDFHCKIKPVNRTIEKNGNYSCKRDPETFTMENVAWGVELKKPYNQHKIARYRINRLKEHLILYCVLDNEFWITFLITRKWLNEKKGKELKRSNKSNYQKKVITQTSIVCPSVICPAIE